MLQKLKKYVIDYGCGTAELYTPGDPEERFYTLANTCFGIRKSIMGFKIISENVAVLLDEYERLEFNGDVYVWREDGARKMLAPYPDAEWDTEYCKECAPSTSQKLAELLQLMADNPDLPVVPMVDSEIVGGDYGARWMGSWGHACIDRYLRGEERLYFYDENNMAAALEEVKGWDWIDEATDAEYLAAYRDLPWTECIVVNIELPE